MSKKSTTSLHGSEQTGAVCRSLSLTSKNPRKGSGNRAHSVATLVLQGPRISITNPGSAITPSSPSSSLGLGTSMFNGPVVLRLCVTSTFDVKVRATLHGAKPYDETTALPDICPAGVTTRCAYVPTLASPGSDTRGTLFIADFDPVSFSTVHTQKAQPYVGSPGKWRYVVLWAPRWNWRDQEDKPEEGKAADLELTYGSLKVHVRAATANELKRCLQLQALRDAEKEEDYDTMHAQMTKARLAGVELEHIERAEEKLKAMRKEKMHISVGCDKDTLKDCMQWERVTFRQDADNTNEPCTASDNCLCNIQENIGESLMVVPSAVDACLGQGSDKELFVELLDAALNTEEGSVWRAGGKFIFSAFNRNQCVIALTRHLQSFGKMRCSKMILDLAKHTETLYGGYVTAVQVNFHPHGDTYHDQHRDVYGGKQRAGPNCACSFREAVGTVCYTLGSSRICQLETMCDEFSAVEACGPDCKGRRERRWLHSGEAMYFNGPWNKNHMHGIPKMEEACGPRISIALLLGDPNTVSQSSALA